MKYHLKPAPKPVTKKGKKTPQQGLEVIQNLMDLPPLPTYDDAMLQEILSVPVPTYENECMQDPSKPLHTNFLVPNRGKKGSCSLEPWRKSNEWWIYCVITFINRPCNNGVRCPVTVV